MQRLARQYGYETVSVVLGQSVQSTPFVVVRAPTDDPTDSSVGRIYGALPNLVSRWAYEGGCAEAISASGTPFAAYCFAHRGLVPLGKAYCGRIGGVYHCEWARTWRDPAIPIFTSHG